MAKCGTSKLQQKVAYILHWHLVANTGIKSLIKRESGNPMAKSGKMQHKLIMAMIGTSFYNWPKFSETANKVVNVRLVLSI